jgi:hypothetical protein
MKKAKPKGRKTAKTPTQRQRTKSAKEKSRNLEKEPAVKPSRTAVGDLLQHMQSAIAKLRETLAKHREQSVKRSERVQKWLKSDQAKQFLKRDPKLKEVFARARAAAKALPKEQAAVMAKHEKALEKMATQISRFPQG